MLNNGYMSAEKITTEKEVFITSRTTETSKKMPTGTVDINNLLARVRIEKQEENKVNMIFFGLFAALVFIVGILLSF